MTFTEDMNICRDLGERAAKARHVGDESLARSHYDYITRLINLYTDSAQKSSLWGAYDNGYKVESASYDIRSYSGRW